MATLFDEIGGDRLRAVLTDFYDRVFGDVMIGFMFVGKDKVRLIDKEWELAARLLGADVRYTGQPLREAHARHRVLGGQFDRRVVLLRQAMAAHQVPDAVRDAWIAHTQALRTQITADRGSECDHDAAAARDDGPPPEPPIGLRRR